MSSWTAICNNERFNLIDYFKENKTIVWRQPKFCKDGDFVFFYLSTPYSEIRFACRVIETGIHNPQEVLSYYLEGKDEAISNNETRWPYMRLQLQGELDIDEVKRVTLMKYGMRSFQKGCQVGDELERHLIKTFRLESK